METSTAFIAKARGAWVISHVANRRGFGMFYQNSFLLLLLLLSRWVIAENIIPPADFFFTEESKEIFLLSEDGRFIATQTRNEAGKHLTVGNSENLERSNLGVLKDRESVVCSFWYSGSRLGYYAVGEDDNHIFGLVEVVNSPLSSAIEIKHLCRFVHHADRLSVVGPRSRKGITAGMVVASASKDEQFDHLYEINLETGIWQNLNAESLGVTQWTAGRSGRNIAGIRNVQGRKELIVFNSGRIDSLLTCTLEETVLPLGFDKSDKNLWVVSNRGLTVDKTRLEEWNLATGQMRVLHTDPRNEVDVGFPVISRGDNDVLGVYYNRDRLELHSLGKGMDEITRAITSLPGPNDDYILSGSDLSGHKWLISRVSDTGPDTTLLYNCEARQWLRLGRNSEINLSQSLGRMRAFRFKTRDDVELTGYITMRPDLKNAPKPTILFVHGGPRMRNQWGYDERVQFLASRGYVVVQVNFRGSEGFGKAFANAGNGEMGTGIMQHDVTDAVHFLVEEGITDSKRVAIFGGSYGGYAALAGMTFTPDLYAAGIDFFGPSDLESYLRELPPSWEPIAGDLKLRMGDPAKPDQADRLRLQSPLYAVQSLRSPLLILHGDHDQIVPTAQSDAFVLGARRHGKQIDYLVLKGGHGFSNEEDEATAFIAIERFLHKHLGGLTSDHAASSASVSIDSWRKAADERLGSRTK